MKKTEYISMNKKVIELNFFFNGDIFRFLHSKWEMLILLLKYIHIEIYLNILKISYGAHLKEEIKSFKMSYNSLSYDN